MFQMALLLELRSLDIKHNWNNVAYLHVFQLGIKILLLIAVIVDAVIPEYGLCQSLAGCHSVVE